MRQIQTRSSQKGSKTILLTGLDSIVSPCKNQAKCTKIAQFQAKTKAIQKRSANQSPKEKQEKFIHSQIRSMTLRAQNQSPSAVGVETRRSSAVKAERYELSAQCSPLKSVKKPAITPKKTANVSNGKIRQSDVTPVVKKEQVHGSSSTLVRQFTTADSMKGPTIAEVANQKQPSEFSLFQVQTKQAQPLNPESSTCAMPKEERAQQAVQSMKALRVEDTQSNMIAQDESHNMTSIRETYDNVEDADVLKLSCKNQAPQTYLPIESGTTSQKQSNESRSHGVPETCFLEEQTLKQLPTFQKEVLSKLTMFSQHSNSCLTDVTSPNVQHQKSDGGCATVERQLLKDQTNTAQTQQPQPKVNLPDQRYASLPYQQKQEQSQPQKQATCQNDNLMPSNRLKQVINQPKNNAQIKQLPQPQNSFGGQANLRGQNEAWQANTYSYEEHWDKLDAKMRQEKSKFNKFMERKDMIQNYTSKQEYNALIEDVTHRLIYYDPNFDFQPPKIEQRQQLMSQNQRAYAPNVNSGPCRYYYGTGVPQAVDNYYGVPYVYAMAPGHICHSFTDQVPHYHTVGAYNPYYYPAYF